MREILSRLRFLFTRRRQSELDEELQFHLEQAAEAKIAAGMTPGEARRRARIEFGGVECAREETHAQHPGWLLQTMLQDVRYALRQLRKSPGFAIAAILTLALGIGAVTAVFSVIYGVLIDPFPYKNINTLATPKLCWPELGECGWRAYTPEQFSEIVHKTDIFSSVTASANSSIVLTGGSEPQRLRGSYTTPNIFNVLGVQPMFGRSAMEDDVRPNHEAVALLSYSYWQAHYGGSHSILGRVLILDGHPRTVIGIMPPRFLWQRADVYLPISMTDENAGQRYFTLVGRLKPGVTEAQAASELKPIFNDFARTNPFIFTKDLRLGIMPFDQMFKSSLASTLHLLFGAVFVLLFIACVNVSSLLLTRAVKREHEFVVRTALGASRLRLARYALTESLLLALVSMPVALAFGHAGLQAILRIVPVETIPNEAAVTMNVPVLLVSFGAALLAVVVFGLAPAWHSARPRLSAALSSGIRSSRGRTQQRLLSGFVVSEIALSLVLLTLAGLMVRSLIALENVPVPFSPSHTLMMHIPLVEERYPTPDSRTRFFRELLDRVRALPGVKAATVDDSFPFMDIYADHVQIGGQSVDKRITSIHLTDPEYLAISNRTMLQGHFLDAREIADQSHEIVITANFAKRYFNGKNALGRIIYLPDFKPDGKNKLKDNAFKVVGVVNDLPFFTGFRENYPHIFLPYTVAPVADDSLIVSTALPADDLVNTVRRIVYSIDMDQPVVDAMSLRQMLDIYGYADSRFDLALFGTFAAAALLLSLVGIYGVFSFTTLQRTQEIGIRMALGAGRTQVMRMVLRQACLLAILGVAIGLILSLAASFAVAQLLRGLLFGVAPRDPVTLAAICGLLLLTGLFAAWWPARRAASVDPMHALRAE